MERKHFVNETLLSVYSESYIKISYRNNVIRNKSKTVRSSVEDLNNRGKTVSSSVKKEDIYRREKETNQWL